MRFSARKGGVSEPIRALEDQGGLRCFAYSARIARRVRWMAPSHSAWSVLWRPGVHDGLRFDLGSLYH